ncbi:uncharacterized protein Z518_06052 [Rhinocladiella mackenziei CBS 650.93]|uniref:Heterokaryon incompatibility domain-containing protein n=1 Tax=Rhinocladiella mackenziei CBS 650.93 TaxID=1442369 RepID=A0A0D2J800_9EURO|nr:uncharacterized protein Z518_06052 [Rhinocladiella mackenziei CBS 650.93]KIX05180.1 hypothetical protein Z518_06052 [Rhinocladiella mackenziei CBS 650.93]
MDYIALHSDNYHPPLVVPCLCGSGGFEYDHKGFVDFPKRMGVLPENIVQGKLDGLRQLDALIFFQSWCFFGLLFEFLTIVGRSFTIEDFVQREPSVVSAESTSSIISTKKFPLLVRELEEESRTLDAAEKAKRFETICERLKVAAEFTHLSATYKIDADGRHFFSDDSINWEKASSLGNVVHLSVVALGEFLGSITITLYRTKNSKYAIDMGPSAFIQSRMIQAGWCPSQVQALHDQKVGVAVMYYLSSMNARALGWNHDGCGKSSRCQFDTLDLQKYRPKHSSECLASGGDNCRFVAPESTWSPRISGIVRKHQTPLITVHQRAVDKTVQICVTAAEKFAQHRRYLGSQLLNKGATIIGLRTGSPNLLTITIPYVCISHVWADGLGNPRENSIPACQLVRLQRLVNELYTLEERPVPFWLDTLCVPRRNRFRRMAIVAMAKIYRQADKVLVLDSSLLQASTAVSPPLELHVRLMTSRWAQRLWTFHEAALAEQLYYQFADRALTRRQLTDLWLTSLPSCRQLVSSGSDDASDQPTPIRGEARKVGLRILFSDPVARQGVIWLYDLERFTKMPRENDAACLQAILNPLRWRTTSWLGDEAICLAGLLDLPLTQRSFLFQLHAAQRLKQLVLLLDSVPLDLLFASLPRSPESGFPWIPSSFLGRGFDASMTRSRTGYITGEGLRFISPGFHLCGRVESIFDDKRVYLNYDGRYYFMVPRDDNGAFEWDSNESSDLAVILRRPLVYPGSEFAALLAVQKRVDNELRCRYLHPILIDGRDEQISVCTDHQSPVVMCTAYPEGQAWCIL